jgi:hypothetical protein
MKLGSPRSHKLGSVGQIGPPGTATHLPFLEQPRSKTGNRQLGPQPGQITYVWAETWFQGSSSMLLVGQISKTNQLLQFVFLRWVYPK